MFRASSPAAFTHAIVHLALSCALVIALTPACDSDEADAGGASQDTGVGGQSPGGSPTGGGGGALAGGAPAPEADATPGPTHFENETPTTERLVDAAGPAPMLDGSAVPTVDGGTVPQVDGTVVPEVDAGPGPEVGACVNPADQQILADNAETLEATVGNCAFQCIADPAPGTCAGACVSTTIGLSAGCAGCFGGAVTCMIANCIAQCIDAASQACSDCRATHCNEDFRTCAGIDPQ